MVNSGVGLNPECKKYFDEMKMKHNWEFLVLKISDDEKQVVVDGEPLKRCTFDEFFENTLLLPGPRWIIFDFPIKENQKKMVLFEWCQENSKPKDKMLFSATKNNVKNVLVHSSAIQAFDADDLDFETLKAKLT